MAETTTIRVRPMAQSRSAFRPAAVAVMVAVFTLAIACATARAAGFVQITGAGGPGPVDLSQLKAAVNNTYTNVATPFGTPGTVTVTGGYPLPMILKHLNIAPSSFQSAEIPAPQGPPVVLTVAEATNPYAYS